MQVPEKIKYTAEISDVKDIRLVGCASPKPWEKHLAEKGLYPYLKNGRAEIVISASDLLWKGFRFNELVISLSVAETESGPHTGYYLIQAFNSSRFFAFCERAFFSTPYHHGKITMKENFSLKMDLNIGGNLILAAETGKETPEQTEEMDNWTGPVFLPSGTKAEKKYFIARLEGPTVISPYSSDSDSVFIHPHPEFPVFEQLLQSDFQPLEWRARTKAFHGKSETIKAKE